MRTLFLMLASLLSATAWASETNQGDTTVIDHPTRVTIVTTDSLQSIRVDGKAGDPDFKYSNTVQLNGNDFTNEMTLNDESWLFSIGGIKPRSSRMARHEVAMTFALGFCNAMGLPGKASVSPLKSWELWWIIGENIIRPWRDRHAFSYGIGLDWRNYRMTDDLRFVNNDHVVGLEAYPEGAAPKFSRIKVFSVTFPLRYHFSDDKHLGFSIGPVINLNTYSSIKTRYRLDGAKQKDVDKNVKVSPVTVDFLATINIPHCVDVYMKYSPCKLLKEGYGPKVSTLSFGFMF